MSLDVLLEERLGHWSITSALHAKRAGSMSKQQKREFTMCASCWNGNPSPEDWHHVCFSDEVHFGWGPQGQLIIIWRPGMRYCQDCIQEEEQPVEKDKKQLHCWVAIGYK